MSKELSRRNFLRGSALSLAAVAGIGALAGCSSEDQSATVSVADVEKWDYAADVVICGFGITGAMAAREAIQQGLSYVILEAAPREQAGGSTVSMGGYYVPLTPDLLLASGNDEFTEDEAQALSNQCIDDFTWLSYCGLTTNDFMKVDGAGKGLYAILEQAMDAMQANVMYETPASHLIADPETDEVFGVIAQAADGNPLYVQGKKGVVLATGSFSGNNELLHEFVYPGVDIFNAGSPYNMGAGLMMGLSVNAALRNMNNRGAELQAFSVKKASEELGTALVTSPMGEKRGARILVNQSGSRFMNEELYLIHFKGNLPWMEFPGNAEQGYQGFSNLPAYMVFDSQLFNSEGVATFLYDYSWAYSRDVYTWSADNKAELNKGWIAQGTTLEELAANLAEQSGNDAIDAAALQATVDAYNIAATTGSDRFGRAEMLPLSSGPYYAVEIATSVMYTIGGLVNRVDGQTLNWEGEHITGLWHAGDVGQIRVINPQGCCPCGALGGLAVRDIAAQEPRSIAGEIDIDFEPADDATKEIAEGGLAVLAVFGGSSAETGGETEQASQDASEVSYIDGTYSGVGNSSIGGDIALTVSIAGTKISDITVDSHNESVDVGAKALPLLVGEAVAANSAHVDTISGATQTSLAFKDALSEALLQAVAS